MNLHIYVIEGHVWGIGASQGQAQGDADQRRRNAGQSRIPGAFHVVDLNTAKRLSEAESPPTWPEAKGGSDREGRVVSPNPAGGGSR